MKWKTAQGKEIPIRELDDEHIDNILDMFEMWESIINSMSENFHNFEKSERLVKKFRPALLKEQKRRKNSPEQEITKNYNI